MWAYVAQIAIDGVNTAIGYSNANKALNMRLLAANSPEYQYYLKQQQNQVKKGGLLIIGILALTAALLIYAISTKK